jgi:oligoribonuclease
MTEPNKAAEKEPIKRVRSASNLVWIDLEMTGLEVETHSILQAALIITDKDLNPLEEFVCDIWQPAAELAKMSPFVRDMHQKTGLLDRVQESRTDLEGAERKLFEIVAGWCEFRAVLCGNTVWQDRKFIDRYLSGLGRYLHYRLVDVSAIKVLAETWYGANAVFAKPKAGAHDALVDIKNSIAELKHYKNTLFVR